jgi:hypothetical protein
LELWADEETGRSIDLDASVKSSGLLSYAGDDPVLFPERASGTALLRARVGLDIRLSERVQSEIAYEQRTRWNSKGAGTAGYGGMLPSLGDVPYRLTALDWPLVDETDTFMWRHEIDRASVGITRDWGQITIGRQAIGLGRALVFSAVDVFAPFSPAEIDREWRRGIDAIRIEYKTTDTSSVELLGAFGRSWDDSALLFRARGYIGRIDGEVIFGKRAEDIMLAGVLSAAVGDAEVHCELALFNTPEAQPDGGLFGNDRLVAKAVLGSSYTFDIGNGLTVMGEYHYSGFGLRDMDDLMSRVRNPDFQDRLLRGDLQNLGQHALGVQVTYPLNESWTGSVLVLESLIDGSGLISPTLNWDFSSSASLRMTGFVPWGPGSCGGRMGSEYGATPASLLVQLTWYF